MPVNVISGIVTAQSGVSLFARLRGQAGQLVTRASLTSITYQVSNLATGQVSQAGTFPILSTIFDSLQQADPRWTVDSAAQPGPDGSWGYNFAALLPASALDVTTLAVFGPTGPTAPATQYQVDVVFTPAGDEPWRVSYLLTALPVFA